MRARSSRLLTLIVSIGVIREHLVERLSCYLQARFLAEERAKTRGGFREGIAGCFWECGKEHCAHHDFTLRLRSLPRTFDSSVDDDHSIINEVCGIARSGTATPAQECATIFVSDAVLVVIRHQKRGG